MIGHLDSFAPIDEGITWDVIVIGAGPAGAVAARQSALAGMRTLLLDRRDFPRSKVCGGCLNGHCLAVLDRIGLSHLPGNLHAEPLSAFRLHAGGRQVTLPMPAGAAVSRAAFDAALVDAAVTAGARFLPRTSARVDDVVGNGGSTLRPVRLTGHGQPETKAVARVVIAADGLTHSSLRDQSGFDSRIARGTRVGIGAALTGCPGGYDRGTIGMAVARGGYVGLVRAEDGRLIVAAALDPHFVKQCGSPQRSVHEVLDDAGVAVPGSLVDIGWQGTVGLTRRTARTAGHRLLVIGDAAGYVEPLTGEGIALALTSAVAAQPFVRRGVAGWDATIERDWNASYRRLVTSRQRLCRILTRAARFPLAVRSVVSLLSRFPSLSRRIMLQLNSPPIDLQESSR